jgi:hypothetical protein
LAADIEVTPIASNSASARLVALLLGDFIFALPGFIKRVVSVRLLPSMVSGKRDDGLVFFGKRSCCFVQRPQKPVMPDIARHHRAPSFDHSSARIKRAKGTSTSSAMAAFRQHFGAPDQ